MPEDYQSMIGRLLEYTCRLPEYDWKITRVCL